MPSQYDFSKLSPEDRAQFDQALSILQTAMLDSFEGADARDFLKQGGFNSEGAERLGAYEAWKQHQGRGVDLQQLRQMGLPEGVTPEQASQRLLQEGSAMSTKRYMQLVPKATEPQPTQKTAKAKEIEFQPEVITGDGAAPKARPAARSGGATAQSQGSVEEPWKRHLQKVGDFMAQSAANPQLAGNKLTFERDVKAAQAQKDNLRTAQNEQSAFDASKNTGLPIAQTLEYVRNNKAPVTPQVSGFMKDNQLADQMRGAQLTQTSAAAPESDTAKALLDLMRQIPKLP